MDNKFAQHIYFERPKEGRPEWIKGRMSLKRDDAVKYLQSLPVSEKGYVYFDLCVSKSGDSLYFKLDDWTPPAKSSEKEADDLFDGGASQLQKEDIPFN